MGAVLERARRAIADATEADALAELEQDWRDAELRRWRREHRRGGVQRVHQCGGCRRMLRSTGERCDCGFQNRIGLDGRNRGGYSK